MAHLSVPVVAIPPLATIPTQAYRGPYGAVLGMPPLAAAEGDYESGVLGKGVGTIAATVRVHLPPEVPLRARVRLMREMDGRVMRETWSDAVTGDYRFTGLDELQTYTALAYHPARAYRAVVADGLVPTTPPPRKGLLS